MADEATSRKQAIGGTLGRFGKVALLVDDKIGADSTTATEIYGAEELPEWWHRFRNVNEGLQAVRHLSELVASDYPKAKFVVIVDRFLPMEAGSVPIDWFSNASQASEAESSTAEGKGEEGGDEARDIDKECEELNRELQTLEELIARENEKGIRRGHVLYVTSYRPSWDRQTENTNPKWQHRSEDPIFATFRPYRSEEEKLEFTPFLTYGPVRRFPGAVSYEDTDPAPAWWETVESVKDDLEDPETAVILLTGGGFSVKFWSGDEDGDDPSQRLRVGIPWNKWLFEYACWWSLRSLCIRECMDLIPDPTTKERRPVPREWLLPSAPDLSVLKDHLSLAALLDAYMKKGFLADDEVSRVSFNRIFYLDHEGPYSRTPEDREKEARQIQDRFREGLRLIMTQHDRGVPLSHWLAARLPLEFVVTTNFDTFHERAAAAAVREVYEQKDARRVLELGSTYDPRPAPVYAPHELEPRLFKLYGSLATPETLAFDENEFALRTLRLEQALIQATRSTTKLTLLVIGHALNDEALVDTIVKSIRYFRTEDSERRVSVVWVDPKARAYAGKISGSEDAETDPSASHEEKNNEDPDPHHARNLRKFFEIGKFQDVTLVPAKATALAFLYDLWFLFSVSRDPKEVDGKHQLPA